MSTRIERAPREQGVSIEDWRWRTNRCYLTVWFHRLNDLRRVLDDVFLARRQPVQTGLLGASFPGEFFWSPRVNFMVARLDNRSHRTTVVARPGGVA
jgi:hypothetical protein